MRRFFADLSLTNAARLCRFGVPECRTTLRAQASEAPAIRTTEAPTTQTPDAPTIQANVGLVLAPVTVTDRKGTLIDGLSVDDFVLTDDGKPQKIRMDTSDTVLAPISMVVLIQSSGISIPELNRIHSIGAMIKPIVTGDRGQTAVLSYDSEVRLRQEFTSDTAKIESAIESTSAYSVKTARLVDAVIEGVDMLATRPENYRRVMLILGEARDRSGKAPLAEAIEKIQRAGVTVYFGTYSAQASAWTVKPENDPSMPEMATTSISPLRVWSWPGSARRTRRMRSRGRAADGTFRLLSMPRWRP